MGLIFSLISCTQWGRMPASLESEKHVVFDIDWTITSEVDQKFSGKRIIEVEGKKYFIHDGLEDFIENLLSKKDIKISFFSGGSRSRNHSLLEKIVLSDGRSLKDIAFKILSKEELTIIEGSKNNEKFSRRYKKDLKKISSDLNNLIMIDDTINFVLDKKQSEHVLFTGNTFQHFETFAQAKTAVGNYVPRTLGEWSFARNKLIILNGAIEEAYKEASDNGLPFKEAVLIQSELLNLHTGEWNDYSRKMFAEAYNKSTKKINTVNSNSNCRQLIIPFLSPIITD